MVNGRLVGHVSISSILVLRQRVIRDGISALFSSAKG